MRMKWGENEMKRRDKREERREEREKTVTELRNIGALPVCRIRRIFQTRESENFCEIIN